MEGAGTAEVVVPARRTPFWKRPPGAALLVWTHRREKDVDLLKSVLQYVPLIKVGSQPQAVVWAGVPA